MWALHPHAHKFYAKRNDVKFSRPKFIKGLEKSKKILKLKVGGVCPPVFTRCEGGILMNKGFTLIELLVVVLIIGILASIALPQYTRAVERSRMAEAVQVLGDLGTAQSIFYMMHNEFAETLPDLNARGDITVPDPSGATWELAVLRSGDDGVQTMTRQGGMYEGGTLRLAVQPNGNINKECRGSLEFCAMAEQAGYPRALMIGGWYPDFGDRDKKDAKEKKSDDIKSLEKAVKEGAIAKMR